MTNEKCEGKCNCDIALRMREFEITQLAQRNNFFMIFQGVMLAGVIQSAHSKPVVSFLVCVAGFFISLFQVGMASGANRLVRNTPFPADFVLPAVFFGAGSTPWPV